MGPIGLGISGRSTIAFVAPITPVIRIVHTVIVIQIRFGIKNQCRCIAQLNGIVGFPGLNIGRPYRQITAISVVIIGIVP